MRIYTSRCVDGMSSPPLRWITSIARDNQALSVSDQTLPQCSEMARLEYTPPEAAHHSDADARAAWMEKHFRFKHCQSPSVLVNQPLFVTQRVSVDH